MNIEIMLHKKFDEISFELSGAIIATFVLIKKTIEEESIFYLIYIF